MDLFKNTKAKIDRAATTVENIAWLAVLSLCTAAVALFVALTRTV